MSDPVSEHPVHTSKAPAHGVVDAALARGHTDYLGTPYVIGISISASMANLWL